jgi:hypothetical protein
MIHIYTLHKSNKKYEMSKGMEWGGFYDLLVAHDLQKLNLYIERIVLLDFIHRLVSQKVEE